MTENLTRLIAVMAKLRDPDTGCPWDVEQTFATIAPYTIEEAYEVADAIERDDLPALRDELGDLLLQVVFHARMAEEEKHFTFDDVAAAIVEKLVRRHPHVFENPDFKADSGAIWEQQKADERTAKAASQGRAPSVLDDVPPALPALLRAEKLQKRAARVGFDWNNTGAVLDKIEEEIAELRAEIEANNAAAAEAELGDIIFAVVNLARHLNAAPETALRATNAKFVRRFQHIEQTLAEQGREVAATDLPELEQLWQAAKRDEKGRE